MGNSKRNITFKCPYCEKRFNRENLVNHIENKHDEMIPENYSAFRLVFDYINKKPAGYNGKCIICGGESGWDESKGKYNRICADPNCKKKYIETFEKNMINSKGVKRISSTAEGQAKMLANRKISGKYKFSDGTERTYTGTYEKKALEFMDKVLECKGEDVVTPGPIMEYMFEEKKHIYISDIYYAPYNLIIEVKDGGDNPNNRPMEEYRRKQVAKEEYIIKNTDFNYLRLTNNNFAQLLSIFTELKLQMIDDSNNRIIRINENVPIMKKEDNIKIFDTPEDLFKWMKSNISYSNFTKLKSAQEVYESKTGSCHDQVMFELFQLRKMGLSPKAEFLIEYNDKNEGRDNQTHSFVYFWRNNKIYWFEHAFFNYAGIHEFDSLKDIKNKIRSLHKEGKMGNYKKYPKIEFTTFKKHHPGETLQQFVDNCFSNSINEAMNALLTGYIPGAIDDPNNTYIVNYMQNNVFSGFGVADNIKLTNLIIRNDKGMLENVGESFLDDKKYKVYRLNKSVEEVSNLLKDYIDKYIEENFIYETLTGHKLYTYDQILFEKSLQYVTSFKTYMNEFGQICRDYFGNVIHKEVEYNQDLETYSLYSIQENGLSEMTAFSTTSFNRIINKNFSVLENLKYSIIDNV